MTAASKAGGTAFTSFLQERYFPRPGAILFALGTCLIAFAFAYTGWQASGGREWGLWLIAILCVSGLSLFFKLRQKSGLGKVHKLILGFDLFIGALWLIAIILSAPQIDSGFQIWGALLLCAASVLAAVNLYNYLPSGLSAIGLALPVYAALLWTGDGNEQDGLALLCLAAWILSAILVWGLHRNFIARQSLVFEKNLLLQNIEDKIIELESLRKTEAQARREAETANQAKSRFLAHSSHDLRQPLHAMGLLLETMPEKGMNKRALHILGRVKQSLDNLAGLFDSLLDVALLDTGQVTVNESVFRLSDVLKQIAQDYSELAHSYQVKLSFFPSTVYIESDPVILHRMIQNLVSNAIKHADGGRVLLGIRRQKGAVSVGVYDTGKGIGEADQIRIFEEFTKLEESASEERVPGLGLGLSIVKRLARIIGVDITLKSHLGKGSAFLITGLKRSVPPENTVMGKLNFDSDAASKEIRIAIIDDEEDVLKATQRIVSKWGFAADIYSRGIAQEIAKPDIILCDYQLGIDQNGIDLIGALRKLHSLDIPAILITANTSREVSDAAAKLNLPVLYKPVKPAQLRSLLLTTLTDRV